MRKNGADHLRDIREAKERKEQKHYAKTIERLRLKWGARGAGA